MLPADRCLLNCQHVVEPIERKTFMERRDFLKLSALGATAIAGGSLITGCAPSTKHAANAHESMASEEPVGISDDKKKSASEESCDFVVVGSGTAGTFAAITAAEAGASVIWLEKTSMKGGTSNFAEGIAGVNSKLQKDAGMSFDKDDLYYRLMDYQDWGALGDVVKMYLDNSGETIDWIAEKGVEIKPMYFPESPATMCLHGTYLNGTYAHIGEGLLQPLWNRADNMNNIKFYSSTSVVDLIIEDGKVLGAYAESSGSKITKINAKAVIFASGGYSSSKDMFQLYTQTPYSSIKFWGMTGRDGDGINLSKAAGGALHAPRCLSYSYGAVEGSVNMGDEVNVWFAWNPLLSVNEKGVRFMDETMVMGEDTAKRNIALTSQGSCFAITDESFVAQCDSMGAYTWGTGVTQGQLRDSIKNCSGIYEADTIKELAAKIGIDADILQLSIDEYNAIAAGGAVDSTFKSDGTKFIPITKAPFYAAKIVASCYGTIGGMATNGNCQVISEAGTGVVEGLYAIGSDNGSLYYNAYPMKVMGGTTQGFAATSGRVAAKHACSLYL